MGQPVEVRLFSTAPSSRWHFPPRAPSCRARRCSLPKDSKFRSVAQPGSASSLGLEGREFESLHSDHPSVRHIVAAVRASLSPDLLKPAWRRIAQETGNPFTGHCYAASEAVFHMLGGAASGWCPCILMHAGWPEGLKAGQTHWFLRHRDSGAVIDPTEAQFTVPVEHSAGRGCGFLTASPSRRAAVLIDRATALMERRKRAGVAKSVDAPGLNPGPFRVRGPAPAPSP